MTDNDSKTPRELLDFPCEFPIKAIGIAGEDFEAAVVTIIRKHTPDIAEGAFKTQLSGEGKYMSMTVTIQARSQEHIDTIYMELSASEHVIMAL